MKTHKIDIKDFNGQEHKLLLAVGYYPAGRKRLELVFHEGKVYYEVSVNLPGVPIVPLSTFKQAVKTYNSI